MSGQEPWSIHSAGLLRLSYCIHFLSQVVIQFRNYNCASFWLRSTEAISYRFSSCFLFNKCGTHLFSFYTLPILLKCVEIVEMDTLSNAHSSCNVVCLIQIKLSVCHYLLKGSDTTLFTFKIRVSITKFGKPVPNCGFCCTTLTPSSIDV